MLFIDEEQFTAKELCELFKLDYDKIAKAPQFENKANNIDPVTKRKRFNKGTNFKSRFFARHPQTGKEVRIQYAKGFSNKEIAGKYVKVYDPQYVKFEGGVFSHYGDIDLAVFFALHPLSVGSPVKTKTAVVKRFEFIDKAARAVKEVENMDNLEKAMLHAKKASYQNLILIAKGLHFKGDIDGMSEVELRNEVRKYALSNTDKYIESIDNNIVKVEGRVRDLVDKKVFVLESKGMVRQWKWMKGSEEGTYIGNQITNNLQDAVESLVNYILDNPEAYIHKLFEVHEHTTVREKAKSFLDNITLPTDEGEIESSDLYVELPLADNESVKGFMGNHGYKKHPTHVKQLREAIQDGTVTSANVVAYMEKNFEKAPVEA